MLELEDYYLRQVFGAGREATVCDPTLRKVG